MPVMMTIMLMQRCNCL